MPKYNIYKIHADKRTELAEKLESVGLDLVSSSKQRGFKYDFYFSKNPATINIWWMSLYEDFLKRKNLPKNKIYFGVLLLYKDDTCFAISLGKSHFYLKNYCDSDFGLDLAERIVDYDKLKVKNSKLFGGRRNKTITSYQQGSPVEYDSGESMQYLKASTLDEKMWGKTVSFGQSVQFNVAVNPKGLPDFLKQIESELCKAPKFLLPRVEELRDEAVIKELDKKLAEDIMNPSTRADADEFSVSGVDFIFTGDNEYSFYQKGHANRTPDFGELSVDRLRKFITDNNLDLGVMLNDIKVKIKNETDRIRTQSLKTVLDYVDDERHCLIDGKWYKFTQSYIDYLQKEADKITMETIPPNVITRGTDEDTFNKARVADGYLNFDKDLDSLAGLKIEKMDLYKNETLYFVKIGSAQKLTYTIDQSIATVKVLQNNADTIVIDDVKVEPKRICLWLIFERQTDIKTLSDVRSLIFLMKLAEWRKTVINADFVPVVRVAYRR